MDMYTVFINSYKGEIRYEVHTLETEYKFNRAYSVPGNICVDCTDTAYIAIL